MFAAARFRKDTILLDALVETLERTFERLVVADNDFCQGVSPHLLAHESPSHEGRRVSKVASGFAIVDLNAQVDRVRACRMRGYTRDVGLEKLIESQIQDAMSAGAFDNLEGAGKPLPPPTLAEQLAGDNWLGFKMLRNANLVPEWLGLGKEIEDDLAELDRMESRYRMTCAAAMASSSPGSYAATLGQQYRAYGEFARAIRKKQERFNDKAPGPRSQRPPIWVEHHLKRLRLLTPEQADPSRSHHG